MERNLWHGFRLRNTWVYPRLGQIKGAERTVSVRSDSMEVLLCLALHGSEAVPVDNVIKSVWPGKRRDDTPLVICIDELNAALAEPGEDQPAIQHVAGQGYRLEATVEPLEPTDQALLEQANQTNGGVSLAEFVASLRKRRVFRVVGAYAIFMWLIIQVADTIFPPLGVSDWVMTTLIWVTALGFPVVTILAWSLQITETTVVVDHSSGALRRPLSALNSRAADFIIIALLMVIIGYLVLDRTTTDSRRVVITTAQGEYELPEIKHGSIEKYSVAVLPFENRGVDPRLQYLATGLAEDILSLLANIRELKVPSRSSSFYFQDKQIDLPEIADRLRVNNVLEGSVEGPLQQLDISARLVESQSGLPVWTKSFTPRNMDLLAVRDEIARSVVESLKVALSIESQNRILRRPTSSVDAYDHYLQALSYLRRPRTEQSLENAEGLFKRALDFDPDYARAYAGLCSTYLGKYRLKREQELVEPAERACKKSLALNPELSEVRVALGSLYRHKGRYDEAEREFQQAIVMNPRLEVAFYGLAMTYKAQDRLDEAEDLFHYAVDLEPGYWGTHLALGNFYLEYGQPADAIDPFRRVTELNPEYALGYNNLGSALYNSGDLAGGESAYLKSLEIAPSEFAYSNMGSVYYNSSRFESAVEMFGLAIDYTPADYRNWGRVAFAQRFVAGQEQEAEKNFRNAIELAAKALEVNEKDWRALAYLSAYYANVGETENALSALDRALSLGPNDPHVHFFGAIANMAMGDPESALLFLQAASRLGYSTNVIASDPDFIQLREDERFNALLDAG